MQNGHPFFNSTKGKKDQLDPRCNGAVPNPYFFLHNEGGKYSRRFLACCVTIFKQSKMVLNNGIG